MLRETGMATWSKVLVGLVVAYAVWAAGTELLWRGSGGCMLVSKAASPTGNREAEVNTCGSSATSLETKIWFGSENTKAQALHATSPVDQSVFEQGYEAITSTISRDYQVKWIDASHLEISVPPGKSWGRDEESFEGITVTFKERSPAPQVGKGG